MINIIENAHYIGVFPLNSVHFRGAKFIEWKSKSHNRIVFRKHWFLVWCCKLMPHIESI